MDIYKCKHCDELFEKVLEGTACDESGCACKDMDLLTPKTADWKNEKHVPIIEKTDNGIKVIVGSTLHPMTDEHYITMIQVTSGNRVYRAYLKPGDKPQAEFPNLDVNVKAIEYCNIHGLWGN